MAVGTLNLYLGQSRTEDVATAVHVYAGVAVLAKHTTLRILWPALLLVVQCVSYVLLIQLSGDVLPYFYTVVSGITGATVIYTIGVLRPFLFGREHIGAVTGIMSVITLIGSALGPLPFGAAFDFFGGYREILVISVTLPAAAAVAAVMIRRPVSR